MNGQSKLIFEEETYVIRAAIFEVYTQLGSGYLEAVYQECLEIEFRNRNIPFQAQPAFAMTYKNMPLQQTFRPDFICFNQIILELKALHMVNNDHKAQLMNYLKVSGLKLGLLVNFGHIPLATVDRVVC